MSKIIKLYKVVSDYAVMYPSEIQYLNRDGFSTENEALKHVDAFVYNYRKYPSNGESNFEFEIVPYYEFIK